MGRRIQRLRHIRHAEEKGNFHGPLRGPESAWLFSPHNFSQPALALRLGLSQSWLAKIEQGSRSLNVFSAHLIAQALGLDPMAILGPLSKAEQEFVAREVADVRAKRKGRGISAKEIAADLADSKSRRRRTTARTKKEQKRLDTLRRASKD